MKQIKNPCEQPVSNLKDWAGDLARIERLLALGTRVDMART